MSRTRTRTVRTYGGYAQYVRNSDQFLMLKHQASLNATESCTDTLHPYPFVAESDLILWKEGHNPGRVNYVTSTGKYGYTYTWKAWPCIPAGNRSPELTVDWDQLETDALVRIQDVEPIVDIPLALFELKDVPRMIERMRSAGLKYLLSPEAYLTLKWEFAPAIRDIQSLVHLQGEIAERMKQHRKKHRRRKARGGLPNRANITLQYSSSPCFIGLGRNWTINLGSAQVQGRCWYSADIEPQFALSELLSEKASIKYQLGLDLGRTGLISAWNALPWSWLVDYFTNLGDLVTLRSNRLPYKVTSLSLMAHCHVEQPIVGLVPQYPYWPPASSFSPGTYRKTYKLRKIRLNPIGGFAMSPILTKGQMINLLALAAAMSKRFR